MEKITEETRIPKELGDMILKECEKEYKKGTPLGESVKTGMLRGIKRYRRKYADKGRD